MFAKSIIFYILSFFTILAAAWPPPPPTTTVTVTASPTATTISQCNTGDAQCCKTVEPASTPGLGFLFGLLGIVVEDLSLLVGFHCNPITIVGAGGSANCAQQPVCCENNNFNGLINVGCTPISL